ncbi:MAG: cytochrome c oxidase assembly protein [Chloroflexota bacterium]
MPAEPAAVVGIVVAAWVYWRGQRRLIALSHRTSASARRRQRLAFATGLGSLLIALESPLDALSADLFAAHMVQHLILLVVGPPLMVLGSPIAPLLWGLPDAGRVSVGRALRRVAVLGHPIAAFGLHSATIWIWHIPVLYEATLAHRGVHVLEHLSFLGTALLFWWAIRRASVVGMLLLLLLAAQSTILGALLTFTDRPWYASQAAAALRFGVDPLQDQQIAGLIMWVPGGVVYLGCGLAMLTAWLRPTMPSGDTPDRAARRAARHPAAPDA